MLIPVYKHTYRIRTFFVLVFLSFFHLIYSQQPDLNQFISVQYTATPLEEVLRDITSKSGIKFSYSPNTIPVKHIIQYSARKTQVKIILDEIFLQAGIQYEIVGEYLVLKKSPVKEAAEAHKPKEYTLSGYITDSSSNEVLIGAAIYNKETGTGVLSNNYGFFSLTLPEGRYTLEASYLGYEIAGKSISLHRHQKWNIQLKPAPSMVEEVVIHSFNKEYMIFNSLAAQTNMDAIEVQKQSAALGETDMLKSLDNLPGISFHNDGSSYFYVRGGHRDQNLIILDEATIYNPSHLLGLFTPIIPDAVKHTEIYKADFPIQYGGRLSSVIDIRTRDGNMQKFSGNTSIGLVSTRISVEGPFKKNSSSYFVSYRRSHFGMFVKNLVEDIDDFYFNDFTTKLNIKLGQKDRLFLTMYNGKDIFLKTDEDITNGLEWGNTSLTLRWNHIYGNRLFSNLTFYTSNYDYFLHTDYEKGTFWNSHISSTNLKLEFTHFHNPKNKIKFGINLGGYAFNPGNYNTADFPENLRVSKMNSGEFTIYSGNEHKVFPRLLLNYGIRITNWSNYGESFIVAYDANYNPVDHQFYDKGERYFTASSVEPRISLSFKTGSFSSLKASYNRTIQHINLINNSISPFNSLEVWLPSGPNIKPQYADIFNIGYLQSLSEVNVDINADIFYKRLYNQVGYSYHAQMLLNPFLEGELRQGNGYAYGFELQITQTAERFTVQMGYAYTRSYLKIEGLNAGRTFPSHQDKPKDFSLLFNYKAKPRWLLNINILNASGMRISTPSGFYYYRGKQLPYYPKQNNDNMPDYKRVDIGSTFRLNKMNKAYGHYLNITLYNFFSYENPVFLYFNKVLNENEEYIVPADTYNTPEQDITHRYVYSMVPSVTYKFQF